MASQSARRTLQDGDLLAAVDLGSNSFHMVVARYVLGQLRIVDRIKETVRLAEGLDGRGGLAPAAMQRAIETLSRFGERLRALPRERVRALATNTVRQLRQPQAFLLPAEAALGHGIEVISGREEARLIYLGVAHGHPPRAGRRRLVMDIGGGSTEFIVGEGFAALERESLQMGCIATTHRFFADGKLGRKRWKDALTEISAEFQQFARTYRRIGWQEAYGASGTIKEIAEIAQKLKLSRSGLSEQALGQIRERLLEFDRIEDVRIPGLAGDRRPVIAGGLLVLEAAFAELGIRRLLASKNALREGALHDMIGRGGEADPRAGSVQALSERYGIDPEQARRVERTALDLFDQAAAEWDLDGDDRLMLGWAARLHEIGLVIAHSLHHQHGAYLLEHSDVAGFSRTEQQCLAALVRSQRRALNPENFEALPDRLAPATMRSALLLRLAVLLHRSHRDDDLPAPRLKVEARRLRLGLSADWLAAHPLTRADLETERGLLAEQGFTLQLDG
jgi:exopolyphosphatase/guanosine-5'-triphosphate,3'-diphosphate pyrophosphatase